MIQIKGIIIKILHEAQRGDWAVIRFRQNAGGEIVATGNVLDFQLKEPLVLYGDWVEKTFRGNTENQFKVASVFREEPFDLPSLERFLANAVAGCGPSRARLLVRRHGEKLDGYLREGRADKLMEVVGVGPTVAQRIIKSFHETTLGSRIANFLSSIGLKTDRTDAVQRALGADAVHKIQKNPYCLTRVQGIGFKSADKVARTMGWSAECPERAEATLLYALEESCKKGHSYLPRQELLALSVQLMLGKVAEGLALTADTVKDETVPATLLNENELAVILTKALDESYDRHTLVKDVVNMAAGAVEVVYLPNLFNAESRLAAKLKILLATKPLCRYSPESLDFIIKESEKAIGIELTEEQRLAIVRAFTEPISILTGGPGTGKTAVSTVLVDVCKRVEYEISMCAPTGRAAKHLSNIVSTVTDQAALTVHRLLKYDPNAEGSGWQANEKNPLETDMVIADEFSMVDVELAYRVADAIKPGTPWIIIGDKDQLPAVSPGRVLEDLIVSNRIVVTRLTKIFRQAAASMIIQNAHRILHGEALTIPDKKDGAVVSDCYLIQPKVILALDEKGKQKKTKGGSKQKIEDYEAMKRTLVQMCMKNIPARINGFNPIRDVQVLTPMKEKGLGVYMLNECMQDALNPLKDGVVEVEIGTRRFRTGDRVQQHRNNYQLGENHEGVYNGDLGFIVSIDPVEQHILVDFGGKEPVKYPFEDAGKDLHLGFCMSIHKSQGSEFSVVIIVLTRANWYMLQRNLLYTAVTRAKQLLVFMCSKDLLVQSVNNADIEKRNSLLHIRLTRGISIAHPGVAA